MGKVERDNSGSSGPTSLLKQSHARAHCMELQMVSSEGDSISTLGNLFQRMVTHTPQ